MSNALRLAWAILALLAIPASSMELGTNFWNPGWHKPNDCFQDIKNVTGDNPWNPQFLKEIAIYRSLRFMDWDNTNNSQRVSWSERPRRDAPKQNPVAYEWMIDLCNRNQSDLWVTLPHKSITRDSGNAPSDYALRLSILAKAGIDMGTTDLQPLLKRLSTMTAVDFIKAGGTRSGPPLDPKRKLYIEYSNETWNGAFKQSHYCCDEGSALGLSDNRWSAGFRFHAWAAIRIFRAADLVFGPDSERVVKVLATQSANSWIAGQHQQVLADPKLNPWSVRATAIATAPYFGHQVPGDATDAVATLRAAIQKSGRDSAKHKAIAKETGLRLITYEGGQHVIKKARAINLDPAMFTLYQEYLREMAKSYDHFCHYAHVGQAGEGGAWGCIEFTGQPLAKAHKYRALVEWSKSRSVKVRE